MHRPEVGGWEGDGDPPSALNSLSATAQAQDDRDHGSHPTNSSSEADTPRPDLPCDLTWADHKTEVTGNDFPSFRINFSLLEKFMQQPTAGPGSIRCPQLSHEDGAGSCVKAPVNHRSGTILQEPSAGPPGASAKQGGESAPSSGSIRSWRRNYRHPWPSWKVSPALLQADRVT